MDRCTGIFLNMISLITATQAFASVIHDNCAVPKYMDQRKKLGLPPVNRTSTEQFERRTQYSNEKLISTRMPLPYVYDADVEAAKGDPSVVLVAGGVNSTEAIAKATTWGGDSFAFLTKRALAPGGGLTRDQVQKGAYGGTSIAKSPEFFLEEWQGLSAPQARKSGHGHIYKGDEVKDILIGDNITVVDIAKASHQEVAEPMLKAITFFEEVVLMGNENLREFEFKYKNQTFKVEVLNTAGGVFAPRGKKWATRSGWAQEDSETVQGSIFRHEVFTNYNLKFANLASGEVFEIDGLTPHEIYRHGWYQGGPYRRSPERCIAFFHPDIYARLKRG